MKTALVTGISGQDGAYLARLLLEKGYAVHGARRRSASANGWRLAEMGIARDIACHDFEILEPSNMHDVLQKVAPDEVYNLAAQSFVAASFAQPVFTAEVDAVGPLRMLESIRRLGGTAKFYQASSSEMFGKAHESPQTERTPFYPRSPYGAAKLFAHWATVNYRESYGIFGASGILFNHESPLRGQEFVTRKIALTLARIRAGQADVLELGNLNAARDWGFAGDFVDGIWRIMQHSTPETFVLATGRTATVRDFAMSVAEALDFRLAFEGEGEDERAIDRKSGRIVIRVNPAYYRPAEVDHLTGAPEKARRLLGWEAKTSQAELAAMMARADYDRVRQNRLFG